MSVFDTVRHAFRITCSASVASNHSEAGKEVDHFAPHDCSGVVAAALNRRATTATCRGHLDCGLEMQIVAFAPVSIDESGISSRVIEVLPEMRVDRTR
jgi:hypothetical protein